MDTQVGLIVKVFIFSALASVLIKYGGRMLPIEPTQTNALIAISVPSLTMALVLWWRFRKNQSLN